MSKIAALIGHGESGKTTFACMCSCIDGVRVSSSKGHIKLAVKNFNTNNDLPQGTEIRKWDIGIIERETVFRKLNIHFIDCSGQLQAVIYKQIHILANDHKFKNKKIDYSLVLNYILKQSDRNTIDHIQKNMKNPLTKWIDIMDTLSKEDSKYEIDEDEALPKIHFMKMFIDADILIFTINGGWLHDWNEKKKCQEDLYEQLNDYSVMASIKNKTKIALMFTQSHLFGLRKNDYSARLINQIYDKFDEFIDKNKLDFKEVLAGRKVGKFCVGVPSSDDKSLNKHGGTDKIFGVEELIEWLY